MNSPMKCLPLFPNSKTVRDPCSHGFGDTDPVSVHPRHQPWPSAPGPPSPGPVAAWLPHTLAPLLTVPQVCDRSLCVLPLHSSLVFLIHLLTVPTSSSSERHISPEAPRPTRYSTSSRDFVSTLRSYELCSVLEC